MGLKLKLPLAQGNLHNIEAHIRVACSEFSQYNIQVLLTIILKAETRDEG